jgi:hypothetical protein
MELQRWKSFKGNLLVEKRRCTQKRGGTCKKRDDNGSVLAMDAWELFVVSLPYSKLR